MKHTGADNDLRWFPDSLAYFSLFGLAVAQPLLDLLSKHPQFFIGRRAVPAEIIFLARIMQKI